MFAIKKLVSFPLAIPFAIKQRMNTDQFLNLLNSPEEQRNQKWEKDFLDLFPKSFLKVQYPDPKPGPDSWPYMFITSDESAQEPSLKLIEWLTDKGIGLVVNPHKDLPDYVFTFGMIWNYRERGEFITDDVSYRSSSLVLEKGTKVQCGEPSPEFLPDYVRKILRQFLMDQGVFAPKVLMVSEDGEKWDLCISADSLGNPPAKEYEGIAEAISWFLPAHYSIAIVNENGLPTFYNL